jgi:hypothetical protein
VRRIDDVRIDVERRRDARVPELLLRDLDRRLEVVQERRMNVVELMPRHPTESRLLGGGLQHVAQQLRLSQRFAAAVPEHQIGWRGPCHAFAV